MSDDLIVRERILRSASKFGWVSPDSGVINHTGFASDEVPAPKVFRSHFYCPVGHAVGTPEEILALLDDAASPEALLCLRSERGLLLLEDQVALGLR